MRSKQQRRQRRQQRKRQQTAVRRPHSPQTADRNGFILMVVLVTVVLLIFAAYNYSGTMLVEHRAVVMGGDDVIARTAAESGVELVATRIMESDTDDTIDFYDNPDSFSRQILFDSPNERGQVMFTVIAFDETNLTTGGHRFGIANESAKFNVNQLLALYELDEARVALGEESLGLANLAVENIPNMTEDILNATLDWLDTDDDRRPGGAETSDYQSLTVPYECKNGPMEDINELLKVQGVLPEYFYGEDTNNNGRLDANENDGDASYPPDNADGVLDLGWKEYLTATSRERNTNPDGDPKINLNSGEMTTLYDDIEELYGEDAASFVVAYRIGGTEYAQQAFELPESGIEEKISRNDINLTVVPTFQFTSLYELIGGETNPVETYSSGSKSFVSPWSEDNVINDFPELEKYLTINDDSYVEGRVNINEARAEVLTSVSNAIPSELPGTIVDDIIASRPEVGLQGGSASIMVRRQTAAWLFTEGLIDLQQLRELGPYITTGGDVHRFQVIGHFGNGGPMTRLEAMVDATEYPPRVMFIRDLTSLGRAFHPDELKPIYDR